MILYHLTLSTGDLRESPRAEVGSDAIKVLHSIGRSNPGDIVAIPPIPHLWMRRRESPAGGSIVEIGVRERIVVLMGVAWDAGGAGLVWDALLAAARAELSGGKGIIAPVLRQPPLPWCAVTLTAGAYGVGLEILSILGDLERCISWTLIEGQR